MQQKTSCFTYSSTMQPNKEFVRLRNLDQAFLLRRVAREVVLVLTAVDGEKWDDSELSLVVDRIMSLHVSDDNLFTVCDGRKFYPRGQKLFKKVLRALQNEDSELENNHECPKGCKSCATGCPSGGSNELHETETVRACINLICYVHSNFDSLSTGTVFCTMHGTRLFQKIDDDLSLVIPFAGETSAARADSFSSKELCLTVLPGLTDDLVAHARPDVFVFPLGRDPELDADADVPVKNDVDGTRL